MFIYSNHLNKIILKKNSNTINILLLHYIWEYFIFITNLFFSSFFTKMNISYSFTIKTENKVEKKKNKKQMMKDKRKKDNNTHYWAAYSVAHDEKVVGTWGDSLPVVKETPLLDLGKSLNDLYQFFRSSSESYLPPAFFRTSLA